MLGPEARPRVESGRSTSALPVAGNCRPGGAIAGTKRVHLDRRAPIGVGHTHGSSPLLVRAVASRDVAG